MSNLFTRTRRITVALIASFSVLVVSGCSLGIMAGKMLFGDPLVTSDFAVQTGFKLEESDKRVLILCSAPHAIKSESPAIEYDIIDGVARRLRVRNVNVVDPDKVADWMDENGEWDQMTEIAVPLKADYIVHLELSTIRYREENSPDIYRGHATGYVYAYEIKDFNGTPEAQEVFRREFTSKYPFGPVLANKVSAEIFKKDYLDRLCDQLAMKFYDHRVAAEID
jgi:hypothetical protein